MANRIKVWRASIITYNQSSFIANFMITDNIHIVFEIFLDMHIHPRVNRGIPLKIDMAKAFDKVEWPFLRAIKLRLGFRENWVNIVIGCIRTATFSFCYKWRTQGFS